MKKIHLIGIGIVVLVAAAIIIGVSLKDKSAKQGPQEEPVDAVMAFYSPWLTAMQSTSTDPYAAGLIESANLSEELKQQLRDSQGTKINNLYYPVLCQETIPQKIGARKIYEEVDSAQILVMSRDEGMTSQAVVTLGNVDGKWQIKTINCSAGEFAPEREFSFERDGIMIKESVKEPYNTAYWHLVYEENGEEGLLVPLFIDQESKCISAGGEETICDPNQFQENANVTIRAQLTEYGAEVKRIEYK